MKTKSITAIAILLWIISAACNYSAWRKNNTDDINEAKTFCNNFYSLVVSEKADAAANYFGGTISKAEGRTLLFKLDSLFGKFQTSDFVKAATTITTKNGVTSKDYEVDYKVTYRNSIADEEFVIQSVNDSLKIVGYHSKRRTSN